MFVAVKRLCNIIFTLFVLSAVGLLAGVVSGRLTFGHGLGDAFYLMSAACLVIFIVVLKLLSRKSEVKLFNGLLVFLMLVIFTYFSLKLTLLRGPEFRWNGELFFS